MTDTLSRIACPDCSSWAYVSFTIILVVRGKAKLTSCARCENCYRGGDKRSLHGSVTLDLSELQTAINNGLPALRVA